jgi:hypothetical protein
MACALCQLDKPLRQSHIASEFLYEPLYDAKHRFRAFSCKAAEIPQIYQKGLREELLCNDCEQSLANKYEDYAATWFYRPAREVMKNPPVEFTMSDLDYHRLKLFFVSLLWRFGNVTDGVFRPANLGPHSEKMRNMLLQNDSGDWLEYPCMITGLTLNGKFYGDFTAGSFSTKVEGISVWAFVFSGFFFNFFVGSHVPPQILHPFFLKPNGTLEIGVKEIREIDSLYEFACGIGAAQLERRTKVKN